MSYRTAYDPDIELAPVKRGIFRCNGCSVVLPVVVGENALMR